MILEIREDQNVLPHFKNILEIHKTNTVIQSIEDCSPMFAGGYPMSLLFAPRCKSSILKIKKGFYSDYDVYFPSIELFEKASSRLEIIYNNENNREWSIERIYVTDNAKTFIFNQKDPITDYKLQLQLVRKITNPPTKILNTFDFINCAIGFVPGTQSFYLHKDIFKYHNVKELEILDPWMLNEVTEETLGNVVIQIARFKKYCERWDYTLGSKAFLKLSEVYIKYPELKIDRPIVVQTNFEAYSGTSFLVQPNTNVWLAIKPYMQMHPLWDEFEDPHGILKNNDSTNPDPLVVDVLNENNEQDNIPF